MMKQNIDNILNQNARHSGMTVPDGYFSDFTARMEASLPRIPMEEPSRRQSGRSTLWTRLRPYAYMAAMFCGVWLMMWVFNDIAGQQTTSDDDIMASLASSDNFYEYCSNKIDEYDLLEQMYDEGVDPVVFANYQQ